KGYTCRPITVPGRPQCSPRWAAKRRHPRAAGRAMRPELRGLRCPREMRLRLAKHSLVGAMGLSAILSGSQRQRYGADLIHHGFALSEAIRPYQNKVRLDRPAARGSPPEQQY